MSFLFPIALVLGALALGIAALHGRRQKRFEVPGLLIWQAVAASSAQAMSAWRLPKVTLPLLLQIAALLALVTALAHPVWGSNRDVEHWVVAVDNAIATSTADGAALEEAKAQAQRIAEAVTGEVRFSLLTTNGRAQPLLARRVADGSWDDVWSRIAAGHGRPDWAGIESLLASVVRPDEQTRIVLVSSALPADFDAPDGAELSLVAVGQGNGTMSLGAQLSLVEGERWLVSGQVRAIDMDLPTSVLVRLVSPEGGEGQILAETEVEAIDGVGGQFKVEFDWSDDGIIEIVAGDGEQAIARFAPSSGSNILNIGQPDAPLALAFKALQGVVVTTVSGLPSDLSGYDLVISDQALDVGLPSLVFDRGVDEGVVRPVSWDAEHQLSHSVDWGRMAIEAQTPIVLRSGERALLAGRNGPLIAVGEMGAAPTIRLGFDPARSNWASLPDLPIFASNVLGWLGLDTGPVPAAACMAGEQCRVPARFIGGDMIDPSGEAHPILAPEFVPQSAGLYRLENGGERQMLAVNPWRGNWSDAAIAHDELTTPTDLTRWFMGLALALLLVDLVLAVARGERGGWVGVRVLAAIAVAGAFVNPALMQPWLSHQHALITDLSGDGPGSGPIIASGVLIDNGTAQAGGGYWDIADALMLADAALGPEGRIVFDANRWDGGYVDLPAGRAIDVVARRAALGDVSVQEVHGPDTVFAGDRILLNTLVEAEASGIVEMVLLRDGEVVQTIAHDLDTGPNRIDFPISELEAGTVHYAVELRAEGDPIVENNRAGIWITVEEPARIAVISVDAEPREQFARMLASQGFDALDLAPGRLPIRQEVYDNYDAVVLLDMPAIGLETRQMVLLEAMVREQGLGLFILGGPNSFGPGGYLETPLEELSPLSARLPHETPEVAIMFVLDSSGSMSQTVGEQTRLDLAKHSVITAARVLDARTSALGVVMFDSEADLALPLQPVPGEAALAAALAAIQPGGGTAIYPGLEMALAELSASDAAARHVVVMTDGMSDPADFQGQLARFREQGITVSAIAIGSTAETNIAEDLALLGGGRFHATADFEALPSILSQEALMLAGDVIETGSFPLVATGQRPDYLDELPPVLAPIAGYVQTTAKPEADVVWSVATQEGETRPVLASWRYGTGNVLALSTAATGEWTESWHQGADYPRLFSQAMRQFLGQERADGLAVSARRDGDEIVVTVIAPEEPGALDIEVRAPDGSVYSVTGRDQGLGELVARFVPEQSGTHQISVGQDGKAASIRFDMGAPKALSLVSRQEVLQAVAAGSGGLMLDGANQGPVSDGWPIAPMRPFWLGLAIALFLLDLIWRYRRSYFQRKRP